MFKGLASPAGRAYIDRMQQTEATDRPADFDVVIYPHRSLGPRGFLILMCAVALVSFTAGVVFMIHGAWPVFGFFGLDLLALYVAFKLSYRAGRLHERLTIGTDEAVLARIQPSGKRHEWRFQPYWLQVVEIGQRPGHLALRSHGRDVPFAAFLTPEERTDLAAAIRGALRELKQA
jgi:uncharacterized membrane protein